MSKIKFALAVNHKNKFESKHFGDAEKYLIYEWDESQIRFVSEISNYYRSYDVDHKHGSSTKAENIVKMLSKENVQVLVSMQFGVNIKPISRHFIPIVIKHEAVNDAIEMIQRNIKWVIDELESPKANFSLLSISNSILKTAIR